MLLARGLLRGCCRWERAVKPVTTVVPHLRSRNTRPTVQAHVSLGGGCGGGGGGGGGPGGNRSFGGGGSGDFGGRRHRFVALTSMAAASLQMIVGAGAAEAKNQPEPEKKELSIEEMAENLSSLAGPVLTNLGFSGVIGVITGITLKKVGQLVALLLGLVFCALQGLTYLGFIDLKWQKIHQTVEKFCDLNKDGKVDEKDLKFGTGKALGILAEGVPSVGGFLAGFAMGVRMG
ncbi:FUN14 family-domain-containing protein [Dunaliella salina]|uniref:FUN14 family-domain-containing protein n=1 Tax=Dunaliella salina TaxID=3046 RepID=A0ABQ7GT94_DUNSA|nr:FUN14 family-domain-containing protein [Dunaliella salina]|eukprot:KAF5837829.1 FUN14 family-domain-containing protein [Dunaliella salina]